MRLFRETKQFPDGTELCLHFSLIAKSTTQTHILIESQVTLALQIVWVNGSTGKDRRYHQGVK